MWSALCLAAGIWSTWKSSKALNWRLTPPALDKRQVTKGPWPLAVAPPALDKRQVAAPN